MQKRHIYWLTLVALVFLMAGTLAMPGAAQTIKSRFDGILVDHDAVIGGDASIGDDLTVTDDVTVSGDLDVDGTANLDAVDIDSTVAIAGALTVGVDGTGHDVIFYSDTAGDYLQWDESAEGLVITGTNAQDVLTIPDGNVDIADDLDVDGTTNLDTVDIDDLVNITRVTGTTGQYEDLILAEWTNSAADASYGSNGIYMSVNPIYDVANAYGLRSRLDLRGATGDVDVNQLHAIDGLINLNETKTYTLTDNISAVGVAIHGGTSGDVIADAAGDPGSLNLFYGVYGPTATVNHTVQTNGMLLMMHPATYVDYGINLQTSADMDAGIYLNSHASDSTAKMDVGLEMTSGASDMINGIDMSAADFTGDDIVLDEGETIDNTTNGVINFNGDLQTEAGHKIYSENATNASVVYVAENTLAYTDATSKTMFVLPANVNIVDFSFTVETAFNDSGTDKIDCGISPAADADDYVDELDGEGAGINRMGDGADMIIAAAGDVGASNVTVVCLFTGQNSNASAGAATLRMFYRVD